MTFFSPEYMAQICRTLVDNYPLSSPLPTSDDTTLSIPYGARILPLQILAANAYSRVYGDLPEDAQDRIDIKMVTYVEISRRQYARHRHKLLSKYGADIGEYRCNIYGIEHDFRKSHIPPSYFYNSDAQALAVDILNNALASESITLSEHTTLTYLSQYKTPFQLLEMLLILILQNTYEESNGTLSEVMLDKIQGLARCIPISREDAAHFMREHNLCNRIYWDAQLAFLPPLTLSLDD
jgi:hypothetical protein